MRAPIVIAIVLSSTLLVVGTPPRATEACSQVGAQLEFGPITGIPTTGVVPFIITDPWGEGLQVSDVIVTDAAGTVVAGSFELTYDRLLWRSDAPLAPSTTYTVDVVEQFESGLLEFTTAADDTPPATPGVLEVRLAESFAPSEFACCEPEFPDSCGGDTCFRLAYDADWTLRATVPLDESNMRFNSVTTDAGAQVFQNLVTARFGFGEDRYCVNVTIRNHFDETSETRTACANIDAAELSVEGAPTPDDIDSSLCEGPITDPETGETVSSGGCNTSGGGTGGLGLLFVMLAIVATRRQRTP